jgi:integrase
VLSPSQPISDRQVTRYFEETGFEVVRFKRAALPDGHFDRGGARGDEIGRLLDAASRLPAIWPLRPQVFRTLFGLLASTGLRVSEALGL